MLLLFFNLWVLLINSISIFRMNSIEKICVQNQLLDINSKLFNIFDEKNIGFVNLIDLIVFLKGQFHYVEESVKNITNNNNILKDNSMININQFNEITINFLNNSAHLFWISFSNKENSNHYDKFCDFFGTPDYIKEKYGVDICFTYEKSESLIIKNYIETCESYINMLRNI